MLIPVLLSGGSGTRLWPISRKSMPKQFVKLLDNKLSLFQDTANRLQNWDTVPKRTIVLANHEHRFIVKEQLDAINADVSSIILEPFGRNTAPAITIAAIEALKISSEAKLLVQPADHLISDRTCFFSLIETALTENRPLVTFGVKPTHPETGYGYIKVGKKIGEKDIFEVQHFSEKPNLELASKYLKDGSYLWNSGIFLFDARVFLNEVSRFNPGLLSTCIAASKDLQEDGDFLRLNERSFISCPNISVDHAVLEKSSKVSVIPFETKWADLGSWTSLSNEAPVDKDRNYVSGNGMTFMSKNTFVHADKRLVVALGVRDLIISETPDVLFVSSKRASDQVKDIVVLLEKEKRPEVIKHTKKYGSWGYYEEVFKDDSVKIRKIVVKPGRSISLQKHEKLSEQRVSLRGEASLDIDGKVTLLKKNESISIQAGRKHQINNLGSADLIMIEIQTGSYVEEDNEIQFEEMN